MGVGVVSVGCCVTHHEFDVIGSDVLDNTGVRGVDGEWGCVIPLHEPDESSVNLHGQTDVVQFGVVLVANVAAYFTVGSVLLCPECDSDFTHVVRVVVRCEGLESSSVKRTEKRSPSMKALGSPKIMRTGLVTSRWPTFWAHSVRR